MGGRKKKTAQDYAKIAARHHTDLNIFASIVAVLEGGTVSSDCQPDDFRVIAQCKRAMDRCLARYDAAIAMVAALYKSGGDDEAH